MAPTLAAPSLSVDRLSPSPSRWAVHEAATQAFDRVAAAQMERMLADLRLMYEERNAALKALEQAHHQTLMRLAAAAELRDGDTGVHIVRIGYLAEFLALALERPTAEAHALRLAAPMHDIGKIGVADQVLKKPGPLTVEERAHMMEHPRMGAEILGRSRAEQLTGSRAPRPMLHPLFDLAAEVALSHHERWDGGGYPSRLAGADIPLSGRIVAVVDFFDALTMDRCYRKALPDTQAVDMLREQSGRAFDPHVVDRFVAQLPGVVALRDWVNRVRPSFFDIASLAPLAAVRPCVQVDGYAHGVAA